MTSTEELRKEFKVIIDTAIFKDYSDYAVDQLVSLFQEYSDARVKEALESEKNKPKSWSLDTMLHCTKCQKRLISTRNKSGLCGICLKNKWSKDKKHLTPQSSTTQEEKSK